jgi:hypothetical protein
MNFFLNLPYPSSRTMALGSTQPLTEMSTRNRSVGKKRPALKSDKLTAICEPIVWRKYGSLYVSQPYGPSRPVTGIALLAHTHTRTRAQNVSTKSLRVFWKIVAHKEIELATWGLRQIIVKLWKFFLSPTDGISGHLCQLFLKWTLCRKARVGWDGFLRQNASLRLNEITAHSSISNLRVTKQ